MEKDITRPEEEARVLARILREEGLAELEFEAGQERFVLRAGRRQEHPVPAWTGADPVEEALEALEGLVITSTRVGVVHLGDPQGGAVPAPVGATVPQGGIVAWIETMGVHQEVRSPQAGSVLEILVAEGEPVEYGQVLMVLGGG